jgi:hypothetical protein
MTVENQKTTIEPTYSNDDSCGNLYKGEAPVEAKKIAVTESRIDELTRKDATVAAIAYVLPPTAYYSTT